MRMPAVGVPVRVAGLVALSVAALAGLTMVLPAAVSRTAADVVAGCLAWTFGKSGAGSQADVAHEWHEADAGLMQRLSGIYFVETGDADGGGTVDYDYRSLYQDGTYLSQLRRCGPDACSQSFTRGIWAADDAEAGGVRIRVTWRGEAGDAGGYTADLSLEEGDLVGPDGAPRWQRMR
jgi:hypothetical protein